MCAQCFEKCRTTHPTGLAAIGYVPDGCGCSRASPSRAIQVAGEMALFSLRADVAHYNLDVHIKRSCEAHAPHSYPLTRVGCDGKRHNDGVLTLQAGDQVMCLRRIPNTLAVNGTTGMVLAFSTGRDAQVWPVVRFCTGEESIVCQQTHATLSDNGDVTGIASAVPLVLAYASTAHKVQGLTLPGRLHISGASLFSPGQLYAMLSRATSRGGIHLVDVPDNIPGPPAAVLQFHDLVQRIEDVDLGSVAASLRAASRIGGSCLCTSTSLLHLLATQLCTQMGTQRAPLCARVPVRKCQQD